MSDECDYCGEEFDDGQEILIYAYECGVLHFCDDICAGAHFVEDCENGIFHKEES
jgi:ribosomal protein L24E